MSFQPIDLVKFLIIIILFLGFSNLFGFVFEKFKQPRVIGEIFSGLLIGNTILFHFIPSTFSFLFLENSVSLTAISGFQELGLLFLMFFSGYEIQWISDKKDVRLSISLSLIGLFIPLTLGYFIFPFFDITIMMGKLNSLNSLLLVFCMAVAVTSIPVISRILMDLDLLGTRFSRIVLTIALIEDLILYGFFSVLLSQQARSNSNISILKKLFDLQNHTFLDFLFNLVLTIIFFVISNKLGIVLLKYIKKGKIHLLFENNEIALIIIYLFLFVLFSIALGIASIFGAFIAGMMLANEKEKLKNEMKSLKSFAYSTFIPIYFIIVGFKLDLFNGFDITLFIFFLVVSSLIKIVSVFIGAKINNFTNKKSLTLGVSLNARGGPGIVLASLAFNYGIISNYFFSALVMTAIFTSMITGYFLKIYRDEILEF